MTLSSSSPTAFGSFLSTQVHSLLDLQTASGYLPDNLGGLNDPLWSTHRLSGSSSINDLGSIAFSSDRGFAARSYLDPSGIFSNQPQFADPLPLTGDTLTTATNLDALTGQRIVTGSVSTNNPNDYFRIQLNATSRLDLTLSGLTNDADLYLIRDANNNGQVDSGEVIGQSTAIAIAPENIQLSGLAAGNYFVQVSQYQGNTSYTLTLTADAAGQTLPSARNIGTLNGVRSFSDYVGSSDHNDIYQFRLDQTSVLDLQLYGLSADADLYLIRDTNGNGTVDKNDVVSSSLSTGMASESIRLNELAVGNYFVQVNRYSGETNYTLSVASSAIAGLPFFNGTLGADTFRVNTSASHSVFSGRGNISFGRGQYDVLDLSEVLSSSVSFDLVGIGNADGVTYNPGNGARAFDAITLGNGNQVLFEGVNQIRFSDRTFNLSITPNDPLFNQQWGLHMMGVQDAWRFGTGNSNVLIGVQDSGLGVTSNGSFHPDLRSTITRPGNTEEDFDRLTSHGTAVQGIIAATSNNGLGMAGINWNSPVINLDVLGGQASDFAELADATQVMINQATQNNQRLVINLSLGISETFGDLNLEPTFDRIVANNPNVLFVIAAGNDGDQGREGISYPASLARLYSNVMAVGASWGDRDFFGNPKNPGERIEYPNVWGSQYGPGLTVMGPSEVIATQAQQAADGTTQFGYHINYDRTSPNRVFNGTSAAAPNVTGVASLVWSANSNLTATQVRNILSETAIDLGAPGYDRFYGSGFVNADMAVRRAIALS